MNTDEPVITDVPAEPTPAVADIPDSTAEEHMIPKSRFDDINKRLKALEKEKAAMEKAAEDQARLAAEEQGKFKELYEKTQAELQAERVAKEAAELKALRIKIGAELKLPPTLANRLQGATEDELRQDAQTLLEALPKPAVGGTDAPNGSNSHPPTPELNEDDIKEQAARLGVSVTYLKQYLEQAKRK